MAYPGTPATDTTSEGTADRISVQTASTGAGDAADRAGSSHGPTAEAGHPQPNPESATSASALELDGLICDIDKSMRYNKRRQAHFERWHRWSMLGIIVMGSAAAAKFKGAEFYLSLAAAVIGAVDLVYSPSIRAAEHAALHRRFLELLSTIRVTGNPSPEQIRSWQAERLKIEADEPPTFWALEADGWNETQRALGRNKDKPNHISWWKRPLKHFVRFEGANFLPRSA
jgi:hypothetical protein